MNVSLWQASAWCGRVKGQLHELRRTGGKYGIISMCIGSGQGAAAVFEAFPTDTHPDGPNANKVTPVTDATLGQGRSA